MGVPVVTVEGDRHASRVSLSLLRSIGRGEWVAKSIDDYVALAIKVAGEVSAGTCNHSGAVLRDAMRQSLLMDRETQARKFWDAVKSLRPRPH